VGKGCPSRYSSVSLSSVVPQAKYDIYRSPRTESRGAGILGRQRLAEHSIHGPGNEPFCTTRMTSVLGTMAETRPNLAFSLSFPSFRFAGLVRGRQCLPFVEQLFLVYLMNSVPPLTHVKLATEACQTVSRRLLGPLVARRPFPQYHPGQPARLPGNQARTQPGGSPCHHKI
jgi:hypothetical protein